MVRVTSSNSSSNMLVSNLYSAEGSTASDERDSACFMGHGPSFQEEKK